MPREIPHEGTSSQYANHMMTPSDTSSDMPHEPEPGDRPARHRIAAQQAAARRARARNRLLLAAAAIIAVVAVVVAIVILKVASPSASAPPGGTSSGGSGLTGAAQQAVADKMTGVPAAVFSQVGKGSATAHPNPIRPAAPPLTLAGKPEMVYIGAEFCPYCAAERWAMITALSRFGTFTGLTAIKSATRDGAGTQEPFAATNTWSFLHAVYASKYLAFSPVELYTNVPDPSTGGYTALQKPTPAQQELLNKYDAVPYIPSAEKGSIPFVDYGGKYLSVGASYDPAVLQGLSWAQIATDLHNPGSAVAKGVLGAVNFMTATLCELTGNQPATACTPDVRSLQSQL
jgi:thiol-disulfide isomerase/thioredoxin